MGKLVQTSVISNTIIKIGLIKVKYVVTCGLKNIKNVKNSTNEWVERQIKQSLL